MNVESSPLRALLKWWPMVLAVLFVVAAGAETRYQVAQLVADKSVNIAQWRLLREQTQILTNHETQIRSMQRHMTPQAIQRWGQIQATVDEDHRRLNNHLQHPH